MDGHNQDSKVKEAIQCHSKYPVTDLELLCELGSIQEDP